MPLNLLDRLRKSNILKSRFLKSVSILASGSVIAMVINAATAPFITRLFEPAGMGVFTYLLAICHLFMSSVNGRYDMSIVTEKKEERVYPLIKLSFLIGVIVSAVVSVGFGIYFKFFSEVYASSSYLAVFIFISLLTYAVINILTSYNNRNKEYMVMTSVYVIRTASQNLGAIVCGLLKMGPLGLIAPYVAGQFLGMNRQAKALKPHLNQVRKATAADMKDVLKRHYKQPLFSAPALFLNSFSYSSITFYMQALYGMGAVGLYSISMRFLGLPLAVVSGNVSKVFFADASREYEKTGQFYRSFRKTSLFLIALAVPMTLAMFFIAPSLTAFVFGAEWEPAGVNIRILAVMFGIRFVTSSVSPGLIVGKKQNYDLFLVLLFILSSAGCFVASKLLGWPSEVFLTGISISYSIVYAIYFFFILSLSKKKGTVNNDTN